MHVIKPAIRHANGFIFKTDVPVRRPTAQLGEIDWGGLIASATNGLVNVKLAQLSKEAAETQAKLVAAQNAPAPAPATGQVYRPSSNMIPLAIGGIALLGLGFFLLKRK